MVLPQRAVRGGESDGQEKTDHPGPQQGGAGRDQKREQEVLSQECWSVWRETENLNKTLCSDELKTLIYLMNKNYGVGSANNIGVTLRLKKKLPSNNFKTKKDFLEQLRIAIITERRRRMDMFYK